MKIETIISLIFGSLGIGALLRDFIFGNAIRLKKRLNATEKGVQALLRSQIISLYNKYIDKGYMPIYERENLEHLYTEYKALGGNGVIEHLKEKLDSLPTE